MDLLLLFGTYPSLSHLVVRLALGVVFVAHGGQKVFGCFGGPGLKATVGYFRTNLGAPPAATVAAALIELLGGAALLVGFLARPAALGIIVVMLVAIAKVHGRHGFFINFAGAPGKGHGFEFNFVLIAMALSIVLGGAGLLSIDRLIAPVGVAWGE
jgi:putative oxidoreductase